MKKEMPQFTLRFRVAEPGDVQGIADALDAIAEMLPGYVQELREKAAISPHPGSSRAWRETAPGLLPGAGICGRGATGGLQDYWLLLPGDGQEQR